MSLPGPNGKNYDLNAIYEANKGRDFVSAPDSAGITIPLTSRSSPRAGNVYYVSACHNTRKCNSKQSLFPSPVALVFFSSSALIVS